MLKYAGERLATLAAQTKPKPDAMKRRRQKPFQANLDVACEPPAKVGGRTKTWTAQTPVFVERL